MFAFWLVKHVQVHFNLSLNVRGLRSGQSMIYNRTPIDRSLYFREFLYNTNRSKSRAWVLSYRQEHVMLKTQTLTKGDC